MFVRKAVTAVKKLLLRLCLLLLLLLSAGKFGGLFASLPAAMVSGLFCVMFGCICAGEGPEGGGLSYWTASCVQVSLMSGFLAELQHCALTATCCSAV